MANSGLIPFGWDSVVAERFSNLLADTDVAGRVITAHRAACLVMTEAGLIRAHTNTFEVCTGDWAGVRGDVVSTVLPRNTVISRAAVSGQSRQQVLAANVDIVAVCISSAIPLRLNRIERLLALVWDGGAQPIVVLTKADLAEDISSLIAQARSAAPGAAVVGVSTVTGEGLDILIAQLAGTVAVIGPSGAGKSTLANSLLGRDAFATGAVRAGDSKGRHTTVRRELVPLPSGGVLIDTPGLRAAGLAGGSDGVERAFSDVESLSASCHFTDCQHETEPGCAVAAAIAAGQLTERRLASYRKLARESEWVHTRTDARLAAERKRTQRIRSRTQRAMYRENRR